MYNTAHNNIANDAADDKIAIQKKFDFKNEKE